MGSAKYVGLDVHKDTISIAVMNSAGKLIMEFIIDAVKADQGWKCGSLSDRNAWVAKNMSLFELLVHIFSSQLLSLAEAL